MSDARTELRAFIRAESEAAQITSALIERLKLAIHEAGVVERKR